MQLQSIDDVISYLDDLIEWAIKNESRLGYFACLYRKMTIAIKEGIKKGEFEDGERMEKVDVVFAQRYVDMIEAWKARERITNSWQLAMDHIDNDKMLVLQHLLLGMSAHINLDLGIAAAEACPGDQLKPFKHDFERINKVIENLTAEVEAELTEIWPRLSLVARFVGKLDDLLLKIGVDLARDVAWNVAKNYNDSTDQNKPTIIDRIDHRTFQIGYTKLVNLGWFPSLIIWWVRREEPKSIPQIIEILK